MSGNQGTEYLKDSLLIKTRCLQRERSNICKLLGVWTFLSSVFCSNIRRVAKSSKSRRTYLNFRTLRQLGHGSSLTNQETLLTDDLDITAGAKEKASQLKDLDGSTW